MNDSLPPSVDARLAMLERRIDVLEARLTTAPAASPVQGMVPPPPSGAPAVDLRRQPPPPTAPVPAPPPQRVPATPSGDWFLRWGGVGLLVLAAIFVVHTAIGRGWIGPAVQLAGALAGAGTLLWIGHRLRATRPVWADAASIGGVLALVATVASTLFVDQFGAPPARLGLLAALAIGLGVAVRDGAPRVAVAGPLAVVPAWLVVGPIGVVPTAAIVAVAFVAHVVLASARGWPAVRLVADAVAAGVVILLAVDAVGDTRSATLAAAVLGAVVAITALAGSTRGALGDGWWRAEVRALVALGPWGVAWIAVLLDDPEEATVGWVALAVAVGLAAVALLVAAPTTWRAVTASSAEGSDRDRELWQTSTAVSAAVTAALGVGLLLDGPALLVALAVETVGLVLLARRSRMDPAALVPALVLGVGCTLGLVDAIAVAWTTSVAVGDHVLHLTAGVALTAAGLLVRSRPRPRLAALGGPAFALAWIGSVLVHLPQGQALVSFVWAVAGVVAVAAGVRWGRPAAAHVGWVILAVTFAKLLTVDLREVDTLWRAVLFLAVGAGMFRLGLVLPSLAGDDGADAGVGGGADQDTDAAPTIAGMSPGGIGRASR